MVSDVARRAFARRLNLALDEAGFLPLHMGRQVEAGKLFGVSQAGVRKWLTGEAMPEIDRLPNILAQLNGLDKKLQPLRLEWLAFGTGPMRKVKEALELSDEEWALVNFYKASPANVRDMLLRMMQQPVLDIDEEEQAPTQQRRKARRLA